MVRVKEKTPEAIVAAMEAGACYATTGPDIEDIKLRRVDAEGDARQLVEATVRCSEARRIFAVSDSTGTEYHEHGETFEAATFTLTANARYVRFEVIDPRGEKAWSNPFDLTTLVRT